MNLPIPTRPPGASRQPIPVKGPSMLPLPRAADSSGASAAPSCRPSVFLHRSICSAAFVLVSLAAGCSSPTPALFNRGDGLREKTVLIVPFSELTQNRWYGESGRGVFLAGALRGWVAREWEAGFADSQDEDMIIDRVRDWPRETISSAEWRSLVRKTNVEYVVVGDLKSVRLKSTHRINLLDAEATVRYRVIDAVRGKEVFVQRNKSVTLGGRTDEIDIPILEMGSDEKKVEMRLLATTAKQIGKELYGYHRD